MFPNFYLQHSLTAMYDHRIIKLIEKEGLKGLGAYWLIIEKMSLLPDNCEEVDYLRPFCKNTKHVSFAYLKKIIYNFELFIFYEDGTFMPDELNPARKKSKKIKESVQENAVSEAKNDENRQKVFRKRDKKAPKKSVNAGYKQFSKKTS